MDKLSDVSSAKYKGVCYAEAQEIQNMHSGVSLTNFRLKRILFLSVGKNTVHLGRSSNLICLFYCLFI